MTLESFIVPKNMNRTWCHRLHISIKISLRSFYDFIIYSFKILFHVILFRIISHLKYIPWFLTRTDDYNVLWMSDFKTKWEKKFNVIYASIQPSFVQLRQGYVINSSKFINILRKIWQKLFLILPLIKTFTYHEILSKNKTKDILILRIKSYSWYHSFYLTLPFWIR